MEESFSIVQTTYSGGLKGDALFINMGKLREENDYIGLWYACDRSEETFITTAFYYAKGDCKKPEDFQEELKENSFKQIKKFTIPTGHDCIWIGMRTDEIHYCRLKIYEVQQEKTYIKYKVIRDKGTTVDVLGKGVMKGGIAYFFKLGIEDNTGEIDFNDTIMYVVFMKDCPPSDWRLDYGSLGIQKLPVFTSTFRFPVGETYTDWYGQNPLDDI
jgi:hypothetical protein